MVKIIGKIYRSTVLHSANNIIVGIISTAKMAWGHLRNGLHGPLLAVKIGPIPAAKIGPRWTDFGRGGPILVTRFCQKWSGGTESGSQN